MSAFRTCRCSASGLLRIVPAALLAFAAGAEAAPPRVRLEPGFGVTPGGLVWTVEARARRLVLRDLLGAERAAFPLGDEGFVLGVADSGARVTSPTPDGLRRGPARPGQEQRVDARFVYRFADGSVRTTVPTWAAPGSEPAFLGDEAFLLRRGKGAWSVVRIGPDGETPVGSIPEETVRRSVGRPIAPRVSAGAGGVAVLFPGMRREGAVRLDHPESVVVPDPLAACGEGRARLVLPHPSGLLRVVVRTAPSTEGEDQGGPLAVAELIDTSGRLERSVALGAWNELYPLPDGGLLALDGMEAARFDDRFAEVSRVVMPLEEGSDPAAAARVVAQVRRLETLGARATGADWAELALLPGAPAARFLDRAEGDAEGALERLARVGDGEAGALEASRALPLLLEVLTGEARATFLDSLGERAVATGGPLWLKRSAAFALLADAPRDAPAWALPTVAEAIAAGDLDDGRERLPEEAFTPELAELVTAVDRARIERLAREQPDVFEAFLAGEWHEHFVAALAQARFHAPAGRFPRTLLDCAAGPPSAAGLLALSQVMDAASASAADRAEDLPADDESAVLSIRDESSRPDRGLLASVLLEAEASPDPGLRASARAVAPLAGLPVDPALFRAEVLRRRDLSHIAFAALTADRSLPAREWSALFLDLFLGARAAAKDPAACTLLGSLEAPAGSPSLRDGYCIVLGFVQMTVSGAVDDVELGLRFESGRLDLLRDFARSGAAPPELKLDVRIGRVLRGGATEEELIEILGERDLPPVFRKMALRGVHLGGGRLSSFLERELASGRVAVAERGTWLDALARLDPVAADRIAAEAWTRGTVPLDLDDGEAGGYARALATERVRESATLRAALRRARSLPAASLEAASALARAGDEGAADPLVAALLETCPVCLPPARLVELFEPLGESGVAALARLADETLPFGTAPIEALFELDATRAEALGRARLALSLAGGCVPEPLLPALLARGIDPFPDVLAALEARGCDRARLRPGEPVATGIARAASTETGQAARRALASTASAACRDAFASLLGIEENAPPEEEP